MSFSTFSGPLRAGTVKEGASNNTGGPILARSATIAATVAKTTGAVAQLLGTLPAGSKFLGVQVEKTVVIAGGTVSAVSMTVGDITTANKYVTSVAIALTATRTVQATIDAGYVPAEMNNIGTADVPIYATFTATTGDPTSGTIVVTLLYQQRLSNGSQDPASA